MAENEVAATPLLLPLTVDVRTIPIMVVGADGAIARLAALDERGASNVKVFAAAPSDELLAAAGDRLITRWPTADDINAMRPRLIFVCDLSDDDSQVLYRLGQDRGVLVHVQDKIPLCDFHMPAILRRGVLQVAVSTGGAAPGLSRLLRDHVAETVVGPEWAERVEEAAAARRTWKAKGFSFQELAKALTDMVAARGWFRRV